jgi:hypothetical protein
MSSDKR